MHSLNHLQHFVGDNGPTEEFPDPLPADPHGKTPKSRKRPAERKSLPHKYSKCTKKDAAEALLLLSEQCPHDGITETVTSEKEIDAPETQHTLPASSTTIKCTHCGKNTEPSSLELKHLGKASFITEVTKNDTTCFRYTGVPSIPLLNAIFEWLEPTAKQIKLWDGKRRTIPGRSKGRRRKVLTLYEEYILTLVRIRRGYDTYHLSYLFGVSQSHVCRIFTAWVNFLHKCFGQLLIWPSQELVRKNLPDSFKFYERTRVVIDCTELYVEKPFRPLAQRLTWSSYKHANTFKLLVGIMPSGAITFLSKLFSGSVSDAAIVKNSGLIEKLEENDDVMADRGFNIRHLFLGKNTTLNIPAFSKGRSLSHKAVKKSRKIASVRIHVERAIRRMKTFKILSGIIPIRMRFLLNQIITIVAVLCNLQDRLA